MAQSVLSNHVTSAEQVNVESKTNYRAEIDGLRALAVLSVVIFHAFPAALTGGFVGVDIFFVISGFLITRHIFENFDQGRFSLVDFFSRRIRRIFPALIFVMVCSLAFGWFSLLNDEYAQLGKHVASGAAFMLNFILVGESGYFDNIAVTKPMLHLWSLAIEEQFYIVWPLIILVAWKFQFNLFKVILLAIFLSFSFNLLFVHSKPTHIFFSPFGRFWELLSGSLLAWLLHYKSTLVTRTTFWLDKKIAGLWSVQSTELQVHHSIFTSANIVSLLGAVLLLYGVIHIDKSFPFPSTWALLPVLGTVFIILSGSTAWFSRIFLMNPIMVWFGLISYSLYLWHWPILSFLHIMEGGVPQQDLRTLAVCVSILCAWLTYQFVEKPLRFGLHRKAKTVLLIFGLVTSGAGGMYVFYHNGVTPYNAELKHITDAKGDWAYPAGLIEQGQGLRTTSHQPPTVLFFGDSHVEAFGPRIVDMYRKGLIQEVGFITSGGCAPIPNVFAGNTYINKCTLNLDNFEKALSSHSIHTIIIGGSYHAYLLGGKSSFYMQGDEKILSSTDNGYEKALQSFYTFVQELSKKNTVIVLSHAAASEKFSPQNMIHSTLDGQRTLPLKLKLQNTPFSIDTSLEEKMKADIEALGITFVSQSQKVCPEGICYPLTDNGHPKYKDSSHMRPFFVIDQMDILDKFILKK